MNDRSIPRQNRVMGYVIQACNVLNIQLLEVYCNPLKCVYRFPGESDGQGHFFLYGTDCDYPNVLAAIAETIRDLEFDGTGKVKPKSE